MKLLTHGFLTPLPNAPNWPEYGWLSVYGNDGQFIGFVLGPGPVHYPDEFSCIDQSVRTDYLGRVIK